MLVATEITENTEMWVRLFVTLCTRCSLWHLLPALDRLDQESLEVFLVGQSLKVDIADPVDAWTDQRECQGRWPAVDGISLRPALWPWR